MKNNEIVNGYELANIGAFHTFGSEGVIYEILEFGENQDSALIRVLATGEELHYPVAHIKQDPIAQ